MMGRKVFEKQLPYVLVAFAFFFTGLVLVVLLATGLLQAAPWNLILLGVCAAGFLFVGVASLRFSHQHLQEVADRWGFQDPGSLARFVGAGYRREIPGVGRARLKRECWGDVDVYCLRLVIPTLPHGLRIEVGPVPLGRKELFRKRQQLSLDLPQVKVFAKEEQGGRRVLEQLREPLAQLLRELEKAGGSFLATGDQLIALIDEDAELTDDALLKAVVDVAQVLVAWTHEERAG